MTGTPAKRKAPYADTKVSVDQTRAEIDALLRRYGIVDLQWTTIWTKGIVKLRFPLEVEAASGESPARHIFVEVTPPPFTAKHQTWDAKEGRRMVESPNWPQSMRCLLHWLKAKLEAVTWGLKAVEEEFLADTIVTDQYGRETTVGKMIVPAIAGGKLELPALAEGSRERDPSKIVDADSRAL